MYPVWHPGVSATLYAGDPALLSSVAATGRVQRLEALGAIGPFKYLKGSLLAGGLLAQKEAYDDMKARG
jgi:oxygen-dependent protoporphyrinogen oxidase